MPLHTFKCIQIWVDNWTFNSVIQAEKAQQLTSMASFFKYAFDTNQVWNNYFDFFCLQWHKWDQTYLQLPNLIQVHSKTYKPVLTYWCKEYVQSLHKCLNHTRVYETADTTEKKFKSAQNSKTILSLEVLIIRHNRVQKSFEVIIVNGTAEYSIFILWNNWCMRLQNSGIRSLAKCQQCNYFLLM